MNQEKQNRILFAFNIMIFILLCLISVVILKEAVIQFFSESSTFMQYDKAIAEYPTITICTRKHKLNYGTDMNITFAPTFEEVHSYHLDVGENFFEGLYNSTQTVKLEPIYSYVISGFCYKITRTMGHEIRSMADGWTIITLNLNKSIPINDLPDFDFYLTSEKNSLGAVYYEWMDGEELNFKISKVSIILHEDN